MHTDIQTHTLTLYQCVYCRKIIYHHPNKAVRRHNKHWPSEHNQIEEEHASSDLWSHSCYGPLFNQTHSGGELKVTKRVNVWTHFKPFLQFPYLFNIKHSPMAHYDHILKLVTDLIHYYHAATHALPFYLSLRFLKLLAHHQVNKVNWSADYSWLVRFSLTILSSKTIQ